MTEHLMARSRTTIVLVAGAVAAWAVTIDRMRYNARVQRNKITRDEFPAMLTAGLLFRDYPIFEVPSPTGDARAPAGQHPGP